MGGGSSRCSPVRLLALLGLGACGHASAALAEAVIPLEVALREMSVAQSFELSVRGDLGQTVPQPIGDVSIEEAIRRLVGDNPVNLMMVYATDDEGNRKLVRVVAQEAREVSAEEREQQRMKLSLGRIEVPPPPPPPPPLGAVPGS